MSEASKFRCPRCGNLLTNITDYSVYRCGACDAVLRAKRNTLELEVLSDVEMYGIGGVSERSSVKSVETNTDQRMMAKRVTRFGDNANTSYASRYENYTLGNGNGNAVVGLRRTEEARDLNHRERPSTSYYLKEENSSKYLVNGNYGIGDSMQGRYQHPYDGIGYIVDDRAKLLQKLNELRDQVNRTCVIADKSKHTATTPYIVDHYAMDANSQHLRRRGLHQPYPPPPPLEHKPFCTHFSDPYMDRNRGRADSFESYSPNMNHHHDLSWTSSQNSKSKLPERWFPHNASEYEASYDDRTSVNELQQRRASVLPFPDESYRSNKSPRVLKANSRQPIAGGAPFLTCRNCSGLLILPKKVLIGGESRKKVKCGACSITIMIFVDTNRLDFSVHVEGNHTYQKDDEGPSKGFHRAKTSFSSEDFDNSGSDFQQRGKEQGSRKSSTSSSSTSSDNKAQNVQTSPEREKDSNFATEIAVKGETIPPPAGSSLQQYFDYSDKFRVLKHMDKSPRQSGLSMINSIRDGSATEIDISSNEFSIAGTSLNSGEASKGGVDKVAEHMKNSFNDMNISKNDIIINEEKIDVTINGKVLPDFLIKKAEKVAGPISHGHYWYDFRAGFWGVMDGPCLGIIPPFIEEFNYPMPESCSGGITGVFVNGRELHEKDLKLLSKRGLPTERDRSYIVEISGRVLDENTGQELERLGKLAPTVEKSNHGFGMRDPQPAAA